MIIKMRQKKVHVTGTQQLYFFNGVICPCLFFGDTLINEHVDQLLNSRPINLPTI